MSAFSKLLTLFIVLGNVGLHKTAHTTDGYGYNKEYPPAAALDGRLAGNGLNKSCAHPSNSETLPAEWWADLGDIYRIYNITIYGRRDCKYYVCVSFRKKMYCIHIFVYVHMYSFPVCLCMDERTCVCLYIYICMYVCMYVCMCVCVCVCVRVCVCWGVEHPSQITAVVRMFSLII